MKKLTLKLSALLLCLFCLFGAVACGQDSPGTHSADIRHAVFQPQLLGLLLILDLMLYPLQAGVYGFLKL